MTTSIVQSITDEQLAEIERDAIARGKLKQGQCEGGKQLTKAYACNHCGAGPQNGCRQPLPQRYASAPTILSVIARLRAAEVLLAGAEERARLLLDSKNQWADRARSYELDAKRLDFMLAAGCVMQSMNGTNSPVVFRLYWPQEGEQQDAWYPTEREAIDAAMESKP